MFGFLKHIVAAIAALGATATGGAPGPVATGSVSAGMQAGPACVTRTLQPGQSASVTVSVVNPTRGKHGGYEKLDMSVQNLPNLDTPQYSTPRSWITFTVPGDHGWVPAHSSATSTFTVTVPAGAKRGRYGFMPNVTAYSRPPTGSGFHIGPGAAAATDFEFSVGTAPPRRAFCQGMGIVSYWPWVPPLPVCNAGQPPLRGQQAMCRVLPLPPPVASARNCHWTTGKWAQYMNQLRLGGIHYGGGPRAYLKDAHCIVDGRVLTGAAYYRRTGMYRYGTGQSGPVSNAPPANDSDSWRTAGSS